MAVAVANAVVVVAIVVVAIVVVVVVHRGGSRGGGGRRLFLSLQLILYSRCQFCMFLVVAHSGANAFELVVPLMMLPG